MDGTMTTFSNIILHKSVEILVKVVGGTELLVGKGSVSYGLGADFSFPHCLVRGRESNEEPSPAGASFRQLVQRYRYWLYFFSPFGIWSAHAQMSVGCKTYPFSTPEPLGFDTSNTIGSGKLYAAVAKIWLFESQGACSSQPNKYGGAG